MRTLAKKQNPLSTAAAAGGISLFRDLGFWNIVILAAVAALFLGYLGLVTSASADGFRLRGLQKQVAALEDENRRAEVEVLGSRAMESVDATVRGLGFVPIEEVDYLGAGATMVAKK